MGKFNSKKMVIEVCVPEGATHYMQGRVGSRYNLRFYKYSKTGYLFCCDPNYDDGNNQWVVADRETVEKSLMPIQEV